MPVGATVILLGSIAFSAAMILTGSNSWINAAWIFNICGYSAWITFFWTSWYYERRERRAKQ